MPPRNKSKITSSIDRIIEAETKKRVKQILAERKVLYFNSFMRWVLSSETLAMITVQNYVSIAKLSKQYRSLRADHFFYLQYLYKVTYASRKELRFMLEKSLHNFHAKNSSMYLIKIGLVEKVKFPNSMGRVREVLVITDKGRKFVESIGNPEAVRNIFKNYKITNRPIQRKIYTQRKRIIANNPELRLDKR